MRSVLSNPIGQPMANLSLSGQSDFWKHKEFPTYTANSLPHLSEFLKILKIRIHADCQNFQNENPDSCGLSEFRKFQTGIGISLPKLATPISYTTVGVPTHRAQRRRWRSQRQGATPYQRTPRGHMGHDWPTYGPNGWLSRPLPTTPLNFPPQSYG